MKTSSFEHGYNMPLGTKEVYSINGYTKCLKNLFMHLAEKTQYKPENRMIDAVEILELIENTNKELAILIQQEIGNSIINEINATT